MVVLKARSLIFICWTSACWAFSFGLGSQAVTHWLHAQDISDTVIGWNHSFYYFGLAVGSWAVPSLMRRFGSTWCVALGLIISGITLAVFPSFSEVWGWYLVRFLNGWAGAMSIVPFETIISRASLPAHKTRNFACYGVSMAAGAALGIGYGSLLFEPGRMLVFVVGGVAVLIAGVAVVLEMSRYPGPAESTEPAVPLQWRQNFLSYGTAWFQGFLEGGMLAFLPLFLAWQGFSTEHAGMLMGVTMIGVIVFQVPVSWLADRYGKTPMLIGCYAVVMLGLLSIPWLPGPIWVAFALFCFGACTGAMYPLGLSLLGDRMSEASLARAYAWYLAIECVGSQAGAAVMGHARDFWGEAAMFSVGLAAAFFVLAIGLGLYLSGRRRELVSSSTPDFVSPISDGKSPRLPTPLQKAS